MAYGNRYGNAYGRGQGGGGGGGYNRGGSGKDFPNSGALHRRDKRSPNTPDYGGQFTIDDDVLDYVMKRAESGEKVELDMSVWQKQGNNGPFYSIKVSLPWKPDGGGNYRSQGRPAERFRDDGPPQRNNYREPEPVDARMDRGYRGRDEEEEREFTGEGRNANPYERQREGKPDYARGRLDQDAVPDFKSRGNDEPPFDAPYKGGRG